MRFIVFILCLFLLSTAGLNASAQKSKQIQREVKRQRKENAKGAKRAIKYGKARHMSIQDKATRKRMKKNLRISKQRNKGLRR